MSVVVNYASDFLTIIATDTRISYGKNAEFGFHDDQEKLINLKNFGWSAGVGLGKFLDEFKYALGNAEVHSVGEIEEIFSKTVEKASIEQPEFKEYIDNSVASFSWIGSDEGKILCRLGLISKEAFDSRVKLLGNGNIFVMYPPEYLNNPELAFELEERYGVVHPFNGSLDDILKTILSIFAEIADKSNSVSDTCDVGIMCILPDGVYKGRIKGEVSLLQTELQSGNIPMQIERIVKFVDNQGD